MAGLLPRSIFLAAVPWLLAPLAGNARAENALPNVLFIFADDWGWGDMSLHDSPTVRTPNLDRFFRQGTEFQQFHVNSPVCSPSRAALYTGQFPGRNKVFYIFGAKAADDRRLGMNDWIDPQVTILPRLMREAGYVTGHYGKWHLTNSFAKGHAPKLSEYGIDDGRCWNGPDPAIWGHDTVYKETMNFIRQHKDVPFFMNLWIRETHTPHWIHEKTLHLPWIEELPEEERVYAAVAWEADQWIGQIMDLLRELDLEEKTIVIFSSDNGPEHVGANTDFNRIMNTRALRKTRMVNGQRVRSETPMNGYGTFYSRGTTGDQKGQKRSHFGGGVRVPFAIRWPGHVPAGRVDKSSVISAVDLLPTFCVLAGVPLPEGYHPDGENILPALLGEQYQRSTPILWENHVTRDGDNWPELAVVKDNWRLVMTKDESRVELYDILGDWSEEENVVGRHPDVVERLKKIALDYHASLPPTDQFDEHLCVPESRK